MKRNMKQWVKDQIEADVKKAMPVLSFPSNQLLGITVRELISNSDMQATGMKLIADRCDTAAALSMMDLSIEAEAFGSQIVVSDIEVPTVTGRIISSKEDAEALKVPEIGAGRTQTYINAIMTAVETIRDRPVFAGVIGPFSLAGRLMDMTEIMVNCFIDPEMVHLTLKKTTEFIIKYIKGYKEAGANGVVIAEPAAGLLSPELNAEFSVKSMKEIIEAVQDDEFVVVYHNCGNVMPLLGDILTIGASAYHFGNAIRMADALAQMPADALVCGNVNPVKQFINGTPESVREETLSIMNECCPAHKNFIISSGCDITSLSKWANIDAFFAAVAEYYAANASDNEAAA